MNTFVAMMLGMGLVGDADLEIQPVCCLTSSDECEEGECNGACGGQCNGQCGEDDDDDDDGHCCHYCHSTCDMPQHYAYPPAYHGYYYFRPYNYAHVLRDRDVTLRLKGDPLSPYSTEMFKDIYAGGIYEEEMGSDRVSTPHIYVNGRLPNVEDVLNDERTHGATSEQERVVTIHSASIRGGKELLRSSVRTPLAAFRTILALLLMASAGALVFEGLVRQPGDLLVGPQNGGRNDLNQFLGFRSLPGDLVARFGQTPVWNPNSLCGAPWLGNPQAGLFYPPNWIYYAVDAHLALSWVMVLHHLWAGAGAFFLCRAYGFHRGAALLGGMAFLACPYYLAHTGEGHYNQVCQVAWFPWALLAYERLNGERRSAAVCLILILSACFFCGHAQEVYYLVLALIGCVVCDTVALLSARELRLAGRLLGRFAFVGCGTAGLVAIELLPNWYYTQLAVRGGGMSVEQAGAISLGWASLRQLFHPMALGGPVDYRGPGMFFWETLCHFGIVPVLLSGLALARGWRQGPVRRMAAIALISLLFAFGDTTPVYPLFHKYVPGVALFRAPARALFLCSLAVAVLAAAGADVVARRRESAALDPADEPEATPIPLSWQFVIAGLFVVCVIESTSFAQQILRTVPPESTRRESSLSRFLSETSDGSRVLCPQFLLSDREAWPRSILRLQGYEPVPLRHLVAVAEATYDKQDTGAMLLGFAWFDLKDFQKPLLDAMGIRFAVTVRKQPEPLEGWRLVSQGRVAEEFAFRGQKPRTLPYFVYENNTALPRAYVVGQASVPEANVDAVQQLSTLDPHRSVLLPGDVLPAGEHSDYVPAKLVEDTPQRVVVDVEISHPGYLVLSDTWYPGWQAFDNGQPVSVLRANLGFRAVPLERGRHTVEFRYTPPGLKLAMLLSTITACVLTSWVWLGRSRDLGAVR